MIVPIVSFARGDTARWKQGGPPHWARESIRLARDYGAGPFTVHAICTEEHRQYLVLKGPSGVLMARGNRTPRLFSALLVEKVE